MIKKALIVILLVFYWLIIAETGTAEVALKDGCGLQIKNFSSQTVDV